MVRRGRHGRRAARCPVRRAEGGYRVSAERRNGRTVRVRVEAVSDGLLRLRDPFDGAKVRCSGAKPRRKGNDFVCRVTKGQVIEMIQA